MGVNHPQNYRPPALSNWAAYYVFHGGWYRAAGKALFYQRNPFGPMVVLLTVGHRHLIANC